MSLNQLDRRQGSNKREKGRGDEPNVGSAANPTASPMRGEDDETLRWHPNTPLGRKVGLETKGRESLGATDGRGGDDLASTPNVRFVRLDLGVPALNQSQIEWGSELVRVRFPNSTVTSG